MSDGVVVDVLLEHDVRKKLVLSDGIDDDIGVVDADTVEKFRFFMLLDFFFFIVIVVA